MMNNQNSKNTNEKLLRIVFAAMFAALIFLATTVIRVPSPLGGFLNFGDCFILVAAWVMGPVYGFAAGGIGSALSDLIGYPIYAPGTFVIKGLIAVAASLIAMAVSRKNDKLRPLGYVLGAVVGELIMIAGYYFYEAAILGFGFVPTLANLPANIIQGAFGAVLGVVLIAAASKLKIFKSINKHTV